MLYDTTRGPRSSIGAAFEIFEAQRCLWNIWNTENAFEIFQRYTNTNDDDAVSYDNKDAENNLKKDNASDGVIRCYYEC